jgi:hypothetical protein
MTLDDLERIAEQAKGLGASPDLLMMARNTAVRVCDGGIDLSPLEEFAQRHGLKFVLNEKVPNGIIYYTQEDWDGNDIEENLGGSSSPE